VATPSRTSIPDDAGGTAVTIKTERTVPIATVGAGAVTAAIEARATLDRRRIVLPRSSTA
jgi:hypothetical protein